MCIDCTGPTAFLDSSGACQCSAIRGMTLSTSVCACDSSSNFEFDFSTDTCVCIVDTLVRNVVYLTHTIWQYFNLIHLKESVDGNCRSPSDSVKWGTGWSSCTDNIRLRILKSFTCSLNSAASDSPWYSCNTARIRISESCSTTGIIQIGCSYHYLYFIFRCHLYGLQCWLWFFHRIVCMQFRFDWY